MIHGQMISRPHGIKDHSQAGSTDQHMIINTTRRDRSAEPQHSLPSAKLSATERCHYMSSLLKCCFTSTETVGLFGTGAQDVHFDSHTAPELWLHMDG